MTVIASIRHDQLESILLYGFLKLKDYCLMEMACRFWRFYVLSKHEVSDKFSHQMDMSDFQSVYNFSNFHHRKVSLQKEQWFDKRKIFCKFSNEVLLTGFDDYSCRIGTDILANRTDIVKFTIHNSYKYIPCTDCDRPDYQQTYDDEVDLAGFINKLCRSQLKELCFNNVPHLGRGLDESLRLKKLTLLKIINCSRVDVFGILEHCYHLQILHYVTNEDSYGMDTLDQNRETMMEVFDNVCKQLHDVYLCADIVNGWGIDDDVISKYHGKIEFTCLIK